MRLLNTKSLEFKQFLDSNIPKYAILSHRWEDPESDLREIELEEFNALSAVQRRGVPKIGTFCSLARAHGFD